MGARTGIEWTDATWNPIRGCSRVSEGCRHCYAEGMAARFSKPGQAYEGLAIMQNHKPHWTGEIAFVENHLLDPLKWRGIFVPCPECIGLGMDFMECTPLDNGHRPGNHARDRRIFVNSMSDLFHEAVTDEMRDKIFAVMALCPQHIFQVLTKRPEQMLKYLGNPETPKRIHRQAFEISAYKAPGSGQTWNDPTLTWPLPNIWLGVSVENQEAAEKRVPLLLQTPAAVRFMSAEPLLGLVNMADAEGNGPLRRGSHVRWNDDGSITVIDPKGGMPPLDWVICGGESGPGARPMHPDWARGLRDQCVAVGVPFFFKQWGEWGPYRKDQNTYGSPSLVQTDAGYKKATKHVEGPSGTHAYMQKVGKHAAGSRLDGVEWKQFPDVRRYAETKQ